MKKMSSHSDRPRTDYAECHVKEFGFHSHGMGSQQNYNQARLLGRRFDSNGKWTERDRKKRSLESYHRESQLESQA